MARIRVSTTVDETLLSKARALDPDATDSSVVERALTALLAQHRRAEYDEKFRTAYTEQPLNTRDDWGDLESFGNAVRVL